MSVKEKLLSLIEQDSQEKDHYLSTQELADKLALKRNTVSHYLNELVKENKLIKVNTRPAIFLAKKKAEQEAGRELASEYDSLATLQHLKGEDVFATVIGNDKSLYSQIKKLKAAASYPGSLPVLINGQTGTGKSYLAKKYFDYCVAENYLAPDSKFISFNCAEYADNPELLTSTLFGYVKGAFTGAEQDHAGLFDQADGGMLFLDEVHRLDAKGQEKLFSYLDTGMISPLGAAGKNKKVNVRLVCATTEEIKSSFLVTFIRRMPVQITMPPLKKRTTSEIRALIIYFYIEHAKKINKAISINSQAFLALTSASFANNIGQLKNDVLLSVASSLEKNPQATQVNIKLADLPQELLLANLDEGVVLPANKSDLLIKPDSKVSSFLGSPQRLNYIQKTIQKIFLLYRQEKFSSFKAKAIEAINSLCDYLIFKKDDLKIGELPLALIKKTLDQKVGYLQNDQTNEFNGNIIVAISSYFYFRQEKSWPISVAEGKMADEIVTKLNETTYVKPVVQLILDTVNNLLNLYTDEVDRLFLTLYLENIQREKSTDIVHCILLAHGYSTASSIADAVNKIMGEPLLDSFDMPIDIEPAAIAQKVADYIRVRHVNNGLVLMADMGSLEKIPELLELDISFPIVIFNNVSTQLALFAADYLKKRRPIEAMAQNMNQNIHNDYRTIFPKMIKQDVIIVCCTTGVGTAIKIKDMIKESLPAKTKVMIKAYSYDALKIDDQEDVLKRKYNILTIIGTANPNYQNIPFISIDQLVNGSKLNVLKEALKNDLTSQDLDNFNDAVLKNFSIERVINSLTILDTKAVIKNISQCVGHLNNYLTPRLPNQIVMALYVHVSCMIERIIRNQSLENSPRNFHDSPKKRQGMAVIHSSFAPLEEIYNIKIPLTEIAYIYELIFNSGNKIKLRQ